MYSDADPMFSKDQSTPQAAMHNNPELKGTSVFKFPDTTNAGARLTSAAGNMLLHSPAKTASSFYKRKDDAQKRAAADIEETLSHLTSVSQKGNEYFSKSKLMQRAKSNASEVKVYHPVGFSAKKMFVSKDAPAQHQQDASFYDPTKFIYRFNETLETQTTPMSSTMTQFRHRKPFDPSSSLPPKDKTHAAGQPSDWAGKPIVGEVRNWSKNS